MSLAGALFLQHLQGWLLTPSDLVNRCTISQWALLALFVLNAWWHLAPARRADH